MYQRRIKVQRWVEQQLQDTLDVPYILYKYIPNSLLQHGCPNCLRATQPEALNDVMEGNFVTVKGDPLILTMWAHYALNSGFVVGYNTEKLKTLGVELRKVLYMELAPIYNPGRDNLIRLNFGDEERRKHNAQEDIQSLGIPLLDADIDFVELQRHWKTLARLLYVKGKSWEYEKEVRLLVDQQRTRLLDDEDKDGWPIRVLDIPTEAIEEVHVGFNTPEKEVGRMAQLVGGERRGWKLKYTSSHAYRMQVTTTINH